MLRDYKGEVTVKIDSIAASAASVIAMAGSKVQMSPVAMLVIHDPSTMAMGDAKAMQKAIEMLDEVKESIINAYQVKTGLSRNRISTLMSNESWLNAKKCVDLGFADEILFDEKEKAKEEESAGEENKKPEQEEKKGMHLEAQLYSTRQMGLTILNHLGVTDHAADHKPPVDTPVIGLDGRTADGSVPYQILQEQLECLQ
jgi:ATP-dependent Clp protease protease subunit